MEWGCFWDMLRKSELIGEKNLTYRQDTIEHHDCSAGLQTHEKAGEKDKLLWEAAIRKGTKNAIMEYLNSGMSVKAYEKEAWERLDEYYWEEACKANTMDSYDRYRNIRSLVKNHTEEANLKISEVISNINNSYDKKKKNAKKHPVLSRILEIVSLVSAIAVGLLVYFTYMAV